MPAYIMKEYNMETELRKLPLYIRIVYSNFIIIFPAYDMKQVQYNDWVGVEDVPSNL